MKIVAVDEHFCTPQIRAAWTALDEQLKDDMVGLLNGGEVERHLEDLSAPGCATWTTGAWTCRCFR